MNRREFHIGPGAASLMLIVVVLAMSILSLLSITNARSDRNLSVRATKVTEEVYTLNVQAERSLAQLDAAVKKSGALPEGMTRTGDEVAWNESLESGRTLHCAVSILPDGTLKWIEHRLETEIAEGEAETWNFWSY